MYKVELIISCDSDIKGIFDNELYQTEYKVEDLSEVKGRIEEDLSTAKLMHIEDGVYQNLVEDEDTYPDEPDGILEGRGDDNEFVGELN